MTTVYFKDSNKHSFIQFEETQLIPQITRAEGQASKWENWFVLNPHQLKQGNLLYLGRTRDDQDPEISFFITEVCYPDEFELHLKGTHGKLHSLKLTNPTIVAQSLAETMHEVDTIRKLIQESAEIYYKQHKAKIHEVR